MCRPRVGQVHDHERDAKSTAHDDGWGGVHAVRHRGGGSLRVVGQRLHRRRQLPGQCRCRCRCQCQCDRVSRPFVLHPLASQRLSTPTGVSGWDVAFWWPLAGPATCRHRHHAAYAAHVGPSGPLLVWPVGLLASPLVGLFCWPRHWPQGSAFPSYRTTASRTATTPTCTARLAATWGSCPLATGSASRGRSSLTNTKTERWVTRAPRLPPFAPVCP